MFNWLIPLLIMGALIGGWLFLNHLDKKRREQLAALADELGLELVPQLPEADLETFQRFELANKGRIRNTGTTIIADNGETRMRIFDFGYTTGRGKNRVERMFAIAMCTDGRLRIPKMGIEPESWQSLLAGLVGHVDVDIPNDPAFSKMFFIRGEDADAIRSFLTDTRRASLARFPTQQLEANGDSFLLIRSYSQLKAENVKVLMSEAMSVAASLR